MSKDAPLVPLPQWLFLTLTYVLFGLSVSSLACALIAFIAPLELHGYNFGYTTAGFAFSLNFHPFVYWFRAFFLGVASLVVFVAVYYGRDHIRRNLPTRLVFPLLTLAGGLFLYELIFIR